MVTQTSSENYQRSTNLEDETRPNIRVATGLFSPLWGVNHPTGESLVIKNGCEPVFLGIRRGTYVPMYAGT